MPSAIFQPTGFRWQNHSPAGQWKIGHLGKHRSYDTSVRFLDPDRKLAVFFGEFQEFVSNAAVLAKGAVTKQLVRFERIIFKKLGYELLKLFAIFFVSKLAAKFPYLLSPSDVGLRRLPVADAVQVWLDRRPARKLPADSGQRPSVEEDVGGGQDSGGGQRRRDGQ